VVPAGTDAGGGRTIRVGFLPQASMKAPSARAQAIRRFMALLIVIPKTAKVWSPDFETRIFH